MAKKIIIILLVVAVGVGIFFGLQKKENSTDLTLYGNIEIRQVDVSFQIAGKIKEILKDEGDIVKKGELIATLDDIDYKLSYEMSNAEVERCKVLNEETESKYKRNKPLVGDSISEQELITLFHNYQQAKANYNVAVANKKIAENKLNYTKLYAPDDGVITVRSHEEGSNVVSGQTIYTITKTKPIWVRAYIEETNLGNIKHNMKAKVLTDTVDPKTNAKKEYDGYVGYISSVAEFTPKTVQTENLRTSLVYAIRVYINENNVDDYLRQGMPVTIKLSLNGE